MIILGIIFFIAVIWLGAYICNGMSYAEYTERHKRGGQ